MSSDDDRKLFVAGLSESIDEDTLRKIFEEGGGTVRDVSLPRDRATGRMRGFGFVTMSEAQQASAAREALDGSVQGGRAISVRAFQSDGPRRGEGGARGPDRERPSADRTLYVGNLPYDCSEEQVVELFNGCNAGPIVRVHLPLGNDGRCRGYGFVTLGSSQAATEAIDALRGADLRGRRLQVNVAQPRGERSDRSAPRGDRPDRPQSRGGDRYDTGGRGPGPRPSGPPSGGGMPPMDGPPGFPDEPPRAAAGRKRNERPDRGDKKKKRGKGRTERGAGPQRRGHERKWQDWDKD